MKTRFVSLAIVIVSTGCGSATSSGSPSASSSEASPESAIVEQSSGSAQPVEVEPREPPAPATTFVPAAVTDARESAILEEFRGQGEVLVFGQLPGEVDAALVSIVTPPASDEEDAGEEYFGEGAYIDYSSDCSRTRLVRVLGQGSAASPLRIEGELRGVCPDPDLSNVETRDYDVDGKLELRIVSRIVFFSEGDSRSGAGSEAGEAMRAVYASMELGDQATVVLSERNEDTEGGEPEESSEARVGYEDLNGDGFMDLTIHRFYASYYCEAEDITQVTPDDAGCHAHASRGVRYYDPEADRWGDFVELEATRVEPAE